MPDTLPLSALQHYLYCPRQCALIHVERVWVENRFTAEGRILHQRADSGVQGRRTGVPEDRAVPIRSDRLGLYGIADVVETRSAPDGKTIPYPVEYKRGKPKIDDCDRVQLCAQGLCLEEMLGVSVPEGAIFYGKPRRRERVIFDEPLRDKVLRTAMAVRDMVASGQTPPAESGPHCRGCSLSGICMPKMRRGRSVESYLLKGLK